ncbi:SigE family RNA polymerase sigma factor [Jiangella ureilytica]|uniref:SigE family RNA polymerase sigma factor n=1 Tax=Jiangella ureilytica TaxID=2530374 RepID=A0A4V2XVY7_9ACTN|nr:SigE family RNA polymerase sigma factor [Jiangella ureilytica]
MVQDRTASAADEAITDLYAAHYVRLVRMATLLQVSEAVAEEVVQDAFVALHRRWRRLRDPAAAVAYLRTSVVHGCRSVHRRRGVAARHPEEPPGHAPSAEQVAVGGAAADAVVAALRGLPDRQREALVLRYYGGLSESEIASAMKISNGAVKSHASRGLAGLRDAMAEWS